MPTSRRALRTLEIAGLTKRYGGTVALDGVTVSFDRSRIYGLVGINGSGKSTLIRIACGIEQPTSLDRISFHGRRYEGGVSAAIAHANGVRVLHQRPAQFLDLTVTENLLLPDMSSNTFGFFNWRRAHEQVKRILESVGLDIDPRSRFDRFSPAQRTLALIGRLLYDGKAEAATGGENRIVILDEPTAALPDAEARWLLDRLEVQKQAGHTIIYVSHRLDELFHVADELVVLRNGRLIGSLQARETDEKRLVAMLLGHELRPAPALKSGGNAVAPARVPRLDVRGLCGREAKGVTFTAHRGEIVGLTGIIGSGFLEAVEMIFAAKSPTAGEVWLDGERLRARHPREAMQAGLGLVPSDRTEMSIFSGWTMRENFLASQHTVPVDGQRDLAGIISTYGIKTGGPDAEIWTLSGGNQQKVVLARWLERNPKVLLLCEPTAGVDPGARDELHTLIRTAAANGCTVLVASTDVDELESLAHRTLIVNRGVISDEIEGGPGSKHRIRGKIL